MFSSDLSMCAHVPIRTHARTHTGSCRERVGKGFSLSVNRHLSFSYLDALLSKQSLQENILSEKVPLQKPEPMSETLSSGTTRP